MLPSPESKPKTLEATVPEKEKPSLEMQPSLQDCLQTPLHLAPAMVLLLARGPGQRVCFDPTRSSFPRLGHPVGIAELRREGAWAPE